MNHFALSAAAAAALSASSFADLNAYEVGYSWSGTEFGGTQVSGYVVDLYIELESEDNVLLNVYNTDFSSSGVSQYHQSLTAAGWAPNDQGSIFTTEASQSFDSFIAIGGVTELSSGGNPIQMSSSTPVSVDPNFGGNNAPVPGPFAGWYNENPALEIGQVGADLLVFVGRFSVLDSAGFSLIGSVGEVTYNSGVGTSGLQNGFTVVPIPAPGALGLLCLTGIASRRRKRS